MLRSIAKLEVFIDDNGKVSGVPSSFTQRHPDGHNYRIVLVPDSDASILAAAGVAPGTESTQTILAHELGHFVDLVTNPDATVGEDAYLSAKLPVETKAWEIAEKIKPDVDPRIKDYVLKKYADDDKVFNEEVNRMGSLDDLYRTYKSIIFGG